MANVLLYVEHQGDQPKKLSLPAITFAQQVCQHTGGKVFLLLAGPKASQAAQQLTGYGAAQILSCDAEELTHPTSNQLAALLHHAAEQVQATMIAAAASSSSKDALPRLAVLRKAGMASDVQEVCSANTFKRPMWAGNVVATVEICTLQRICTVRSTSFAMPSKQAGTSEQVTLPLPAASKANERCRFVSFLPITSERPDVTVANRVVSGGRGVKSAEGFKIVEQLADALGAGVGASRAVCDAGWVPNDLQIGQTGKVVAPDLYIALGISGAIQHLAGMKGSKTIVAINKDPEAPIFQVADYGLVADLFQVVPELLQQLKK